MLFRVIFKRPKWNNGDHRKVIILAGLKSPLTGFINITNFYTLQEVKIKIKEANPSFDIGGS